MDTSAVVAKLFEHPDVSVDTSNHPNVELIAKLRQEQSLTTQMVQPVLLQTPENKVLLFVGTNSIANIDAVAQIKGGEVQAVSKDYLASLINKKGLKCLPAAPGFCGFEVLVDAALMRADTIYLPCGFPDQQVVLNKDSFKQLIGNARVDNFSIPLAKINFEEDGSKQDIEDIHQAIRKYSSLQIRKRLSETLEIPPLSDTAQQIIKLSADPNTDADKLVAVVELDPGLSAQVVGWAASPYYSAPGKVNSIQDAIVRVLGFELVLNLALGLAIGKSLRVPNDNPDGVTPYWLQSVYCALTAEKLNRCLPPDKRGASGLCYLSGLLNNFGYLILAHVFPTHYSTACRFLEANPHINHKYIEQYLIGVTRDQMSSQLMESWNLPPEIVTSMRHQQDPDYNGDLAYYPNLSLVAKRLLAARGIGDVPAEPIPEEVYERLGLDKDKAKEILDKVLDCFNEIDNITSIFAS